MLKCFNFSDFFFFSRKFYSIPVPNPPGSEDLSQFFVATIRESVAWFVTLVEIKHKTE